MCASQVPTAIRARDEPAAAIALLDELNAACRGWYDECAIRERPELEPRRAVSGEAKRIAELQRLSQR
jgi:hypothetical protein